MVTEDYKFQLEKERQARKTAEHQLELTSIKLERAESELLLLENKFQSRPIDIPECKKSADAKQYVDLAKSIEEFIYYADFNGNFIFMNHKGPEKFGYSFEDLSGKHYSEFVHPEDFKATKQFYKEMIQNEVDQSYFEFRVMTKEGKVKWVGQSVTGIRENGHLVKFAAVARDITKPKQMQLELEEAKAFAEASQKAEKQFLTNMSHEIRTPLNAIIGMSHLIQDTQMSKEQEEYIDILSTSANILHSLISDILDFSKIDSGNIEVHEKEVNLVMLLDNLRKTFSLKLENKPIEFICEIDSELNSLVMADELLLNQIFFNLIGNAEKFTDEGVIKLALKVLEKTESNYKIRFEISDSGIGISEKDQVKIFQQFVQVSEERKYSYGGTGLGLAITRKILEILGGELKVQSKLNEGTTFFFEINLTNTNKTLNKSNKVMITSEQFLKADHPILVVEDNVMNRKYIKRLLNKWSLDFEIAVNGLEAVEKCSLKKYSLIFMDIQMPVMDGYEATSTIKKECSPNLDTPIIALTASSMISMKNKAFELGMNDFLAKPFNPFQLAEMLRTYLKPSAHQDEKTVEITGEFRFDTSLNEVFLKEAYGDDLDHAVDMFETFLEVVNTDYQSLVEAAEKNDMETCGKLSHKMKPIFTMVGLDNLSKQFEILEKMAKANEQDSFVALFKIVGTKMNEQIDLIKTETGRLYAHLQQTEK